MAKKPDIILEEHLVKNGIAKKNIVEALLKESEKSGKSFVSVLVKHKISSEKDLLEALAQKLKLRYIDLNSIDADSDAIEKVPIKLASYYKILPIKLENRTLTIVAPEPLDTKTLDAIRMQVGYDVEMALAPSSDIEEAVKTSYGVGAQTIEQIISSTPAYAEEKKEADAEVKIDDIDTEAGDVSIIKLVNQIILEAYNKRATDIHIEPYRGKVGFRYRIDGLLYDANVPDKVKHFLPQILSRIKIMANLDIVERRLPQDGRAIVKVQDKALDLRISFIPTPFGESVVIRVLPTTMFFDLVKLGLAEEQLDKISSFIEKPHGIIFVTGPTGSGKTTSLYACLSKINTSDRKVITIEDPIEYEMSGITQIQVANEIGLDFARGLRSMLRHDPDVMMVGEVRDRETAEIAIRVALTGHLVFSTLHTNDAASGITRLVNIGVEPYLVSSSVLAFIAQRLVRVNCPHCKEECVDCSPEVKNLIAKEVNLKDANEVKLFKSKGCTECNNTGYFGRTAIYEILTVDETIQQLIMTKSSTTEVRKAALKSGMKMLRQDGWRKVLEGVTTPDEVLRVTQKEEGVDMGEIAEAVELKNVIGSSPDETEEKAATPVEVTTEKLPEDAPEETSKEPKLEEAPQEKVVSFEDSQKEEDKSYDDPIGRRVYPRVDDRLSIRFRIMKHSKDKGLYGRKKISPECLAATKNISAGGLLFVSNEAPPANSIIEVKIDGPGRDDPVECLAKVVRVVTIEEGKIYNVAVSFLDISSKDRAYLDKYVRGEMKNME